MRGRRVSYLWRGRRDPGHGWAQMRRLGAGIGGAVALV